jgi:hypothetical protein
MKLIEDQLFEMANLHKRDSALPVNLYFTCNGYNNIKNHNCLRIKVQQDNSNNVNENNMSELVFKTNENWDILDIKKVGKFKISDSDLNTVINYIKSNWSIIVDHWIGKIYDKDFLIAMPLNS